MEQPPGVNSAPMESCCLLRLQRTRRDFLGSIGDQYLASLPL